MPQDQFSFFASPRPTLRHLVITATATSVVSASQRGHRVPLRNVDLLLHVKSLRDQIKDIESYVETTKLSQIENGLPEIVNLVLEIETAPDYPLSSSDIHSLTTDSEITLAFAR